jgi:hypothetical protein
MNRPRAAPERARTAVRKTIKHAVDAVVGEDPVLGEDLGAAVSTGWLPVRPVGPAVAG